MRLTLAAEAEASISSPYWSVGRVDESAAIVMSMRVKYNIHLDGKVLESFVGTSRKHLYDHKPALELR